MELSALVLEAVRKGDFQGAARLLEDRAALLASCRVSPAAARSALECDREAERLLQEGLAGLWAEIARVQGQIEALEMFAVRSAGVDFLA